MFNLENKITWKELAPSLQAMFKTLQSQITDVKNDINNINISLGDINDHLTQIDNDINEINTTIENNYNDLNQQITDINNNITTIIEDMAGEMMFLNLAPKIGYYQEDKIEVISKYNMNVTPSTDNNKIGCYGITSDSSNREVMYFLGNDGGYKAFSSGKFDIYYAYRYNDNTSFNYVNECIPIDDKMKSFDNEYNRINQLYTLGNGWMYISYIINNSSSRLCLIRDTSMDTEFSNATFKRLTILESNQNIIRYDNSVRYFPQYNKIVFITCINESNNAENQFRLRVADPDNNTILYTTDFYGPNRIAFLPPNSSYSFVSNADVKQLFGHTTNSSYAMYANGWTRSGFEYDFDNERLVLNKFIHFELFLKNTSAKETVQESKGSFKTFYHIPKSLITSNSGNVTLLNATTYDNGKSVYENQLRGLFIPDNKLSTNNVGFPMAGSTILQFQASYDEKNSRYYIIGTSRDRTYFRKGYRININRNPLIRDNNDEHFVLQNNISYHILSTGGNDNLYLTPPDTSLFGKTIYKYAVLNFIIFRGISVQNSNMKTPIIGSSNKFKRTYDKATFTYLNRTGYSIEPIMGTYMQLNTASNIYQNREYFTTILANGKPQYGFSYFKNDNSIPVHIFSVPSTMSESFVATSSYLIYTFPNLLDFFTGYTVNRLSNDKLEVKGYYNGYDVRIMNPQYNSLGNFFLCVAEVASSNAPDYEALYVCTLNVQTKKCKIYSDLTKFTNSFKHVSQLGVTQPNNFFDTDWKGFFEPLFSSSREVFITFFSEAHNALNYSGGRYYIKFNSDLTDIELCKNAISSGIFLYGTEAGGKETGVLYCEQFGALVFSNEGWGSEPLTIISQKPILPASEEADQSIDTLDNMLCNITTKSDIDLTLTSLNAKHIYQIYVQSSQGLVAYIPSIPIFLGGYFSIIENPIPVTLKPNSDNYIYIERDSNDRTSIIASSSTTRTINEGDKVFNKILCAKCTTNDSSIISVEYYRINTGYNDYSFN